MVYVHVRFVPNALRWRESTNACTTSVRYPTLYILQLIPDETSIQTFIMHCRPCCSYTNTVTLDLTPYHPPQSFNAVHRHERNLSPWFFELSSQTYGHIPLPRELQTFIMHRRQCCFYMYTSRFDSLSSATVFQRSPPSWAQSISLVLSSQTYGHIPLPRELQTSLLEQALRNLTRSLHNQELWTIDRCCTGSCPIAQYFFFNRRVIEGNRQETVRPPYLSCGAFYSYATQEHDTVVKRSLSWYNL